MDPGKTIVPMTFMEFWERLPENERLMVDILRQIVLENLPEGCREKLAYNVPFYYGNKRICLIWPSSVPRGGFNHGVLLGFNQGDKLKNPNGYVINGTNKKVYYRIFFSPEEINEREIILLLKDAVEIDRRKNKA